MMRVHIVALLNYDLRGERLAAKYGFNYHAVSPWNKWAVLGCRKR